MNHKSSNTKQVRLENETFSGNLEDRVSDQDKYISFIIIYFTDISIRDWKIIELFLLRSQASLGVLFSSLSSSFWVSRMLFSNDFFLTRWRFILGCFIFKCRVLHFPEFRLI